MPGQYHEAEYYIFVKVWSSVILEKVVVILVRIRTACHSALRSEQLLLYQSLKTEHRLQLSKRKSEI